MWAGAHSTGRRRVARMIFRRTLLPSEVATDHRMVILVEMARWTPGELKALRSSNRSAHCWRNSNLRLRVRSARSHPILLEFIRERIGIMHISTSHRARGITGSSYQVPPTPHLVVTRSRQSPSPRKPVQDVQAGQSRTDQTTS